MISVFLYLYILKLKCTLSILFRFQLGDNNIAPAGVYEIFRALSSEESAVEVLCLKVGYVSIKKQLMFEK